MALSFGLASYGYVLNAPAPRAAMPRVSMPEMAAIKITGVNVEVTEALRSHAESKMSVPLDKFASVLNDAKSAELLLKVEGGSVHDEKHKGRVAHIAEAMVTLKGKQRTITVTSESEDMYSTIDELETMLARKLRKAKEQWADKQKVRGAKGKDEMEEETFDVDADADAGAESSLSAAAPGPRSSSSDDEAGEPVGAPPAGFSWGATF